MDQTAWQQFFSNRGLGIDSPTFQLADVAYQNITNAKLVEQTGRFVYFMQILGQTYVNLGDFSKANQILQQALTFAEESHYMQVKAKILNGLAEIHLQQAFALALTLEKISNCVAQACVNYS